MKFKCLIGRHEWVVGRAAQEQARQLVTKKNYHNRACKHCGKEEWNADEAEAEADKVMLLKDRLGYTRKQAELGAGGALCDPHEFP
jgi:hypothetical protein